MLGAELRHGAGSNEGMGNAHGKWSHLGSGAPAHIALCRRLVGIVGGGGLCEDLHRRCMAERPTGHTCDAARARSGKGRVTLKREDGFRAQLKQSRSLVDGAATVILARQLQRGCSRLALRRMGAWGVTSAWRSPAGRRRAGASVKSTNPPSTHTPSPPATPRLLMPAAS